MRTGKEECESVHSRLHDCPHENCNGLHKFHRKCHLQNLQLQLTILWNLALRSLSMANA